MGPSVHRSAVGLTLPASPLRGAAPSMFSVGLAVYPRQRCAGDAPSDVSAVVIGQAVEGLGAKEIGEAIEVASNLEGLRLGPGAFRVIRDCKAYSVVLLFDEASERTIQCIQKELVRRGFIDPRRVRRRPFARLVRHVPREEAARLASGRNACADDYTYTTFVANFSRRAAAPVAAAAAAQQ